MKNYHKNPLKISIDRNSFKNINKQKPKRFNSLILTNKRNFHNIYQKKIPKIDKLRKFSLPANSRNPLKMNFYHKNPIVNKNKNIVEKKFSMNKKNNNRPEIFQQYKYYILEIQKIDDEIERERFQHIQTKLNPNQKNSKKDVNDLEKIKQKSENLNKKHQILKNEITQFKKDLKTKKLLFQEKTEFINHNLLLNKNLKEIEREIIKEKNKYDLLRSKKANIEIREITKIDKKAREIMEKKLLKVVLENSKISKNPKVIQLYKKLNRSLYGNNN